MIELAQQNAKAIGAGHSFIIFLGEGFFPINVLNQVKMVPEVCRIYCATANMTDVIVLDVGEGRAILGVADGKRPEGIEDEDGIAWRKSFLRMIGYKQ
jgi:adenosine/AMP kinase